MTNALVKQNFKIFFEFLCNYNLLDVLEISV